MENVTQWRGTGYNLWFTSDITGIWFQIERDSWVLSLARNGLIPTLRHFWHPWKSVDRDYLSYTFWFTATLDVSSQIAVNNTGAISMCECLPFMCIFFSFSKTQAGTRNWILTFWHRSYFFLILARPIYKTWIIQEQNTLELWNKLRFEEKNRRVYSMFKIFSTYICWINI